MLTLALLALPASPAAGADPGERDSRSVAWHALRREALLAGAFLPPYRPVTLAEATHERSSGDTGRQAPYEFGGRVALHELGPGDLVEGESGLGGRGLVLVVEPQLVATHGRRWAALTLRLAGSLHHDRAAPPAGLLYPGWPAATGRSATGAVRRDDPVWRLAVPQAAVGVQSGRWAFSAGLFAASVGPGLDGDGLTLGSLAESVPQLVVRRVAPMRWSGPLRALAPQHVLLRAGWTSPQTLRYETEWGRQERRAAPMFSQWLLTWNHTAWLRTTVTHAALAAPRAGHSLWADLAQINVPLLGATWSEVDHGPVTDRLFSLAVEARFRAAPWPLLPRAAGRVWWEYGGEDFRPHDKLALLPEIAAPASLIGVELVDRRWDVGAQFLETRHPRVLWYSNSGFAEGYTHRGVLLGHPLGGAVQAWTAVVRWRPGAGRHEWDARWRTASWQEQRGLPARARREQASIGWRAGADARGASWRASCGWVRETVGGDRLSWAVGSLERSF